MLIGIFQVFNAAIWNELYCEIAAIVVTIEWLVLHGALVYFQSNTKLSFHELMTKPWPQPSLTNEADLALIPAASRVLLESVPLEHWELSRDWLANQLKGMGLEKLDGDDDVKTAHFVKSLAEVAIKSMQAVFNHPLAVEIQQIYSSLGDGECASHIEITSGQMFN